MSSIIVFMSGGEITAHISKLKPRKAALEIANRFEGFSTDDETTKVVKEDDKDVPGGKKWTVVLTNPAADDGSGPDHDLAYVVKFSKETVAWALAKVHDSEYDAKTLQDAGALG